MPVLLGRGRGGIPAGSERGCGVAHDSLSALAASRNGEKGRGSIDDKDIREQNRLSWNVAVGALDSHRGDLAGFLRAGGTTLFYEERELLGDLAGETVAHLQCNSGG